jgi:DNA-binding FrmR family transcriptional regulator
MQRHNHPQNKEVINRLSRIIGHLEAVKRMTEEGRDCSEVLIQIAAVRSALNNVGKIILEDHINHCIVEAIENNDTTILASLNNAIDKFINK